MRFSLVSMFLCAIDLGLATFSVAWFNTESETLCCRTLDLGSKIPCARLAETFTTKFLEEPMTRALLSAAEVVLVERPLEGGRFQHLVTTKLWVLYTVLQQHPLTRYKFVGVCPRTYVPRAFGFQRMERAKKKAKTVGIAMLIAGRLGDGAEALAQLKTCCKPDDQADAILIAVAYAAERDLIDKSWLSLHEEKERDEQAALEAARALGFLV